MHLRTLALTFLLVPLAGCIEGEPIAFADGSEKVDRLRVNAYATPEGALVETTGIGRDGDFHAFRGRLVVVLERQHPGEGEPAYGQVREYVVEVEEDDFAHPEIPMHRHVIPAADLGEPGTFRVRVSARVGERDLGGEPALFAFPAA